MEIPRLYRSADSGGLLKSVQFQTGITVQFAPESVSSFSRNQCPVCAGIGVQFGPEYAIPKERLFNDPTYKRLHEKWCAAWLGIGYKKYVDPRCMIDIDDVDEQREYDFFLHSAGSRYPFQICEVLDEDRRRGAEYKAYGRTLEPSAEIRSRDPTKYAISRIVGTLEKKRNKHYAGMSDLHILLYLNMTARDQAFLRLRSATQIYARSFASVWVFTPKHIGCLRAADGIADIRGWRPLV